MLMKIKEYLLFPGFKKIVTCSVNTFYYIAEIL